MTYPTTPGFARGSDTSEAAAASLPAEKVARRKRQVLAVVRARGGATCAEIAAAMHSPMHAISGRVRELVLDGLLVNSGRRRIGSSGRPGVVWEEVAS
jgi:predicted ArsR family transcriptional regulator